MMRSARLTELLNPVSQETQQGDRDHGQEQAQGDEDRQLAALDGLEAALDEQQQADVAAAFEFLAAAGQLILDGRRALSQRLASPTSQTGLRGRSGAGLIRAVGVAVHAATPFDDHRVASGTGGVILRTMALTSLSACVASPTASMLDQHHPEGMSGSHRVHTVEMMRWVGGPIRVGQTGAPRGAFKGPNRGRR
jgi:hypothetical protein